VTTLVAVQNGTEISSPTYTALVLKYRTFAKQTAENIIKLAETLLEADEKLSKTELRQFCAEVGLEHDGSTYRKLMKIGKEVSRFEPFVERLPNNWTTVYKLAKLEKNVFDQVANDNRFSPMMTSSEIDRIVGGSSPTQIEHLSRDVTIDLSGYEANEKTEFCLKVGELVKEYGFKMKISHMLEKELPTEANTQLQSLSARVA
jgi:hypothetical protein